MTQHLLASGPTATEPAPIWHQVNEMACPQALQSVMLWQGGLLFVTSLEGCRHPSALGVMAVSEVPPSRAGGSEYFAYNEYFTVSSTTLSFVRSQGRQQQLQG